MSRFSQVNALGHKTLAPRTTRRWCAYFCSAEMTAIIRWSRYRRPEAILRIPTATTRRSVAGWHCRSQPEGDRQLQGRSIRAASQPDGTGVAVQQQPERRRDGECRHSGHATNAGSIQEPASGDSVQSCFRIWISKPNGRRHWLRDPAPPAGVAEWPMPFRIATLAGFPTDDFGGRKQLCLRPALRPTPPQ